MRVGVRLQACIGESSIEDLARIPGLDPKVIQHLDNGIVKIPVTHAKAFGWYDNEYGGYTNLLGDLTVHVHQVLD